MFQEILVMLMHRDVQKRVKIVDGCDFTGKPAGKARDYTQVINAEKERHSWIAIVEYLRTFYLMVYCLIIINRISSIEALAV